MVRLTGKMTAESAKTLKDLAEAATVLLEQLDARDEKAEKSTRKQITIAVWSVGISAVLALFALVVSGLSYYQDKANNAGGDKWQAEMLAAFRDERRQSAVAQKDAERLTTRAACATRRKGEAARADTRRKVRRCGRSHPSESVEDSRRQCRSTLKRAPECG
jgi:hypothetical protein